MKKIKVCHVVCGLKAGGVESMIYNYCSHLDNRNYDWYLLYQHKPAEKNLKEFGKIGFKMSRISSKSKHPIKNYKETKKYLKVNKIDVVHCHMTLMNFIPLLAAKRLGIKTRICHSHNADVRKRNFIIKIIQKIIKNLNIRLSTDLVACGKDAGNYMYGNKKYTIINNAMDLEKYMFNKQKRNEMRKKYDIGEEKIVIGHIGRFTKQKNHEFIIYLFQKLLHKNKNFILFLVGNGEEQDKIKNIVREKHLEDKVIFEGIIDNTFEIYNLFDIFILPSLYEGMPVVSIEAQLSGLYCIFSSNIDEEALINTGKVKMLDLDVEIWKENILEIINDKNLSDREVVKKQFIDKGLDIVNETQKLEKIYRGEIE